MSNQPVRCPHCAHNFTARIDHEQQKEGKNLFITCPSCGNKNRLLDDGVLYLAPMDTEPEPSTSKVKTEIVQFRSPLAHFFWTTLLALLTAGSYYSFVFFVDHIRFVFLGVTVLLAFTTLAIGISRAKTLVGVIATTVALHFAFVNGVLEASPGEHQTANNKRETAGKPVSLTKRVAVDLGSGPDDLGIYWGMKQPEIESLGYAMVSVQKSSTVEAFKLLRMPDGAPPPGSFFMVFHKTNGIQKIILETDEYSGDGREALEFYDYYKSLLEIAYGKPEQENETLLFDSKDGIGLFECLGSPVGIMPCGMWNSLFQNESDNIAVVIKIIPISENAGVVQITFQGPSWPSS